MVRNREATAMLRISKLTDYAIIVLGQMARQPERSYAANELAESAGINAPTASKVLKMMTRAGLLESIRGAKGGYQLVVAPEKTTIARIIAALEGPIALTECGLDHNSCDQSRFCQVKGNWSLINGAIRTALEAITLKDMTQPMSRATVTWPLPRRPIDPSLPQTREASHGHQP